MTNLTYSGENNFMSEENIKNIILKILIFYSVISFILLMFLTFSGLRLFNSLNLSMTIVSAGGFLPTENLKDIILTNFQKIILILV